MLLTGTGHAGGGGVGVETSWKSMSLYDYCHKCFCLYPSNDRLRNNVLPMSTCPFRVGREGAFDRHRSWGASPDSYRHSFQVCMKLDDICIKR